MAMIPSCLTSLKELKTPAEMSFMNAIFGMKGNSDSILLSHLPFVSVYPAARYNYAWCKRIITALSLATLPETERCGIYQSISTGPTLDDQLRIWSSPVNLANEVNLQGTKSDCCNLCQCLTSPGTTFQWISLWAYLSLRERTKLSLHLWIIWLSTFMLFLPLQRSMQRALLNCM